ncbi:MAG TPA: sensor histidine kinase N-terminal domain-containing protein, partial [Novosphingobium sp.]|nr:sensor histidine kinase N-terminal domain-containing protein [Novosphingobium sp.]
RAIADSLSIDEGHLELNLSPGIFGMLEDNARDSVFYAVRRDATVLTGYADLPDIVPQGLGDLQMRFGTAHYHGRDIRIVAEGRRMPGIARPLVIEVAETMKTREAASRHLLLALFALEAMLVMLTTVLLPLALRWGMQPLRRLHAQMEARDGADLTPLPTDNVPGELRYLVEAFNGMLARLDTALQAMRQFTADASHQMRTPLSILRTHIALLRDASLSDTEARASIADIDEASGRLQRLLVQLLALARADNAAAEELALAPIDLGALARDVAAEHVPAAMAAGIDLQFVGDETPARALGHAALAGELLANLIDNAVRYNHPGGQVQLRIEREGDRLLVVIEDNGPGIPAADRERVFERFTRLRRDGTRSGSGLGLPIARMLAGVVGAQLTLVDSQALGGLRACVAFQAIAP